MSAELPHSLEANGCIERVSIPEDNNSPLNNCRRLAASLMTTIGLTVSLLAVDAVASDSVRAETVASIEFSNEYPYLDARAYNTANYEWWVDENGNGAANVTSNSHDDDESMSALGYGYRNCADGVAYWVQKNLS